MGGAERNARKRRQAQTSGGSKAVTAARKPNGDRKKVFVGAGVVVVLLVAVVVGVVIYNNQKNTTEGQAIDPVSTSTTAQAAADYPVTRDGAVVTVGESTAKVTLDVYEDFLCPACGQFERQYAGDIDKHIADGTVQVRYHMLPMLNEQSDPPGYSMDSANAGLCAADAGAFPAFHKSLFANQPEEGSRGWDKEQLAKLGTDLGITSADFKTCVTSGEYNDLLQSNFDQVQQTAHLQQEFPNGQKGFGTPTLAVGEKIVETTDANWLENLVKSAE